MTGEKETREKILEIAQPIQEEYSEHYFRCISGISRMGIPGAVFFDSGNGPISLRDLLEMARVCGRVEGIVQGLLVGSDDRSEVAKTLLEARSFAHPDQLLIETSTKNKKEEAELIDVLMRLSRLGI